LTPSTPRTRIDSGESKSDASSVENGKRRRSASLTLPIRRPLSSSLTELVEFNLEDTTASDDGIQRRHSIEGFSNDTCVPHTHRERPKSPHSLDFEAANEDISILANIDETTALYLSVLSMTLQQDIKSPSRERCHTDPLNAGQTSVAVTDPIVTCTDQSLTADRGSPGLRKRHSFSSLKHVYETAASSRPRAISFNEDRARTPSESLDNRIASTGHHLSDAEDDEEEDPSREWFWIWA